MELALLVPTLILGFLLWQEKREARIREDAWRVERAGLLTRIQAPELAPTLIPEQTYSDEPLYVPPDDDEAFRQYLEDKAEGKAA